MGRSSDDTLLKCDVAVIGAGTAGLVAERHARKAGAKTLLIDPEFRGTTCAAVGCMPSKLLIAAADAAHGITQASQLGIDATAQVDGPAVMKRVQRHRDRLVESTKAQIRKLPDGVCVKARAKFSGPNTLDLDNGQRVHARAVIIATGAAPTVPDAFSGLGDRLLTNENVFDLEELPTSLGVVGAGPVGLEIAQAMSRLGVDVTVVDHGNSIAALSDPAVANRLHDILSDEFPICLGVDAKTVPAEDKVKLSWQGDSSGEALVSHVFLAVGRPANLEDLNLAKANLKLDDHGTPVFDRKTMQCGDAPIFIAGDANHDRPLLHEAADEGAVAGHNAAKWPDVARSRRKTPLSIVFTRPTAASVGKVPFDAEADMLVGSTDFENQGRATIECRAHGGIRLYAEKGGSRLSGAEMCLPDAEHLAHLLCWAIESGMTVSQLLDSPFYHPTLEEGLKPALRDLCEALQESTPWDRADGHIPGC
ncbi:dihydrolipoyl dehydrogenase [Roseovarius pelagicus]|uniref:Dihydrolipoyl dehydrogenase n=1 Tax=Roseovarius pelagicus TaxID=2980108 RepID=A0ABY6DIH5_9RHOB|nr:dihydrolipoyl dehydrogenase [Roseovarius pelagicus]UXX84763.1 dihydrolipoyl dehydrogenase [Roseovarius pelagicus]